MLALLPKWSKTTWIGLLIPVAIVLVRIPSAEILIKIFERVSDSGVFRSPLFFPSPTIPIGDAHYHGIGSNISSLLVLVGFMIFVGGRLYRTESPDVSAYLKRWASSTFGYLGLLLLSEIPALKSVGGQPDAGYALIFGHGPIYLLAFALAFFEEFIVFIFWWRKMKRISLFD